jgi:Tfp pilus assembly protein PilN
MIRINLLPEEYRRKSRTPVKLMLTVAGVVSINAGLLAWWGFLAFGIQAEIESERAVLQTETDGLTPQVNFHHALEGERSRFASRESALAAITKSRVGWTRKIDELIDVINDGGEGRRHFVWLDDLNVSQRVDARTKSAGTVKAAGHSGSSDFGQVANFLEDVERSPFIQDFDAPAPPEGTQTMVDKELVPAVVWAFPVSLSLKAKEEPAAKKPAPKPAPAPAAATAPDAAAPAEGAKQ